MNTTTATTHNDIQSIRREVVRRLRRIHPQKIILFGSHAHGNADTDSDIDLYVITRDTYIPQNFSQKMALKLKVTRQIRDLKKRYDFDIIVHTQKMHERFVQMNSLFAQEILQEGVTWYE